MVSGSVRIALYPLAAATIASPIPVFPEVGSIMVAHGFRIPFSSASSTAKISISAKSDIGSTKFKYCKTNLQTGCTPSTEISKYIAKKEDECYRVVKILWTCREDIPNGQNYLSDAVSWCDSNVPFKFDYINENPEITFNHKELVRKIIADVYIDDAAINPFYL